MKKFKLTILKQIPLGVWVTGGVSLLTDISLEMVHTILPLYMVGVLGASVMSVGFIEGVAEGLSHVIKVFSGSLSDFFGKRKPIVVVGYSLNVLAKPVMALASSVDVVFLSRLIDRTGRGVRGAPRDALIADITPKHLRGASFGVRETMDGLGQIMGPIVAFILLYIFLYDYQTIFWLATIPAVLAVVLLVFCLREPKMERTAKLENPLKWHKLQSMGAPFWWLVVFGGFLMLARFADAFLVLKAYEMGLEPYQIPLIMIIWNLAFALSAYPMGKLADGKIPHKVILFWGVVLLALCDIFLAFADNWTLLILGAVCWGLHVGFTQGLMNNMIAGVVPRTMLGTAYGFFNLVRGVGVLGASAIAGIIWSYSGSQTTFLVALSFVVVSLISMLKLK